MAHGHTVSNDKAHLEAAGVGFGSVISYDFAELY
jgi:hypothetical protein